MPRDGIEPIAIYERKPNCEQRKAMYYLRPLVVSGYAPQGMNQNCRHNMDVGVRERHYCPVPPITEKGMAAYFRAFKNLKRIARASGVSPGTVPVWSEDQVLATRAPSKRPVYAAAYESLRDKPLDRSDWKVDAFVKFEHGPLAELHSKAPRLVQHRSSRFTAALARYLAPVEKALYTLKYNGHPMFAKSMNSYQRAKAIVSMSGYGRIMMGLDHSRFDSHCVKPLLELEHRFYMWLFKNDPELQALLSHQLRNRVYGPGFKLVAEGGRMSGDFNTSLGNNVINAMIYLAWFEEMGVEDTAWMLLDGDDGVAGLPACLEDYRKEMFLELGMTTKFDEVAHLPEQVSFCQMRPVQVAAGSWRMLGDYRRALSRMPITIRHFIGEGWHNYGRCVALCRAILGDGAPVLSALGTAMLLHFPGGTREMVARDKDLSWKIANEPEWMALPVSDQCRASYAVAYGISPDEQRHLEACIATHDWSAPTRLLRSGISSVVDLLPTEP